MRIALSIAHASWSPHRSGYEWKYPWRRPEEYCFSRNVAESTQKLLTAIGHDAFLVEKDDKYKCCCTNAKTCGRYGTALIKQVKKCIDADLVIEVHLNNGPPGNNGAFCLYNGVSILAHKFSHTFLTIYSTYSPIDVYHYGTYPMPLSNHLFGSKWFFKNGAKNAVIIEAGHASSATDAAYLQTPHAYNVCARAIVWAIAEAERYGLD